MHNEIFYNNPGSSSIYTNSERSLMACLTVVSQFHELLYPFEDVYGTHDGVAGHLFRVLFMWNDYKIDGIRVVELVGISDDLLEFLGQTPKFDVVKGGGQCDEIVTEARDGVHCELSCLQGLLRRLGTNKAK